MPHSLPAIIAHVRAQARPASYGGMLLAEIDRLTALLAELFDNPGDCDVRARVHEALKETTDV